jgi:hypothetical protein
VKNAVFWDVAPCGVFFNDVWGGGGGCGVRGVVSKRAGGSG